VATILDAHVHKTIATLRADGAPRISGIETIWAEGELWFGSMTEARKAEDLRRDPRFALHSGSDDPPGWSADAKLGGRAEEVLDAKRRLAVLGRDPPTEPSDAHLFRAEIESVAVVGLNEARDRLVIEFWTEGRGLRRIERE
jgi:hypothetical protein